MNRAILLILALSALLAFGYARSTPIGAAPDEGPHLQFVRVVAEERRLPVLNTTQRRASFADLDYESHQAPLYYVLAAPFYQVGKAVAGEAGAGQGARLLSVLMGLAGTALVWLLARELFPARPALWAVAAALAAFLPMRLHVMASVSNDTAAEATASLALLFMVRSLTRSWGIREAAFLGLSLGVALLAKQSNLMLFPPALVAIFLASRQVPEARGQGTEGEQLTIDNYQLSIVNSGKTPKDKRQKAEGRRQKAVSPSPPRPSTQPPDPFLGQFLRTGLVVAGVVLLLAGWWFVRNQQLYGDPMAKKAFDWYFADTPTFEAFKSIGYTFEMFLKRLVFPTTFATFWGAFGYLVPDKPYLFMGAYGPGEPSRAWGYPPKSWVYPILFYLTLFVLLGLVVGYLARRFSRPDLAASASPEAAPDGRMAGLGLLGLHALFVFSAFLNFNATYFQAQGRYLFPALGFLAVVFAGGWLAWPWAAAGLFSQKTTTGAKKNMGNVEAVAGWLMGAALLLLATYALFGVVHPAFNAPPVS